MSLNETRPPEYRDELLGHAAIKETGWFEPAAVDGLVKRCRAGRATGFLENQALVGILSAQLWHRAFFAEPATIRPLPIQGADVVLGSSIHAMHNGSLR